MVAIIRSHVIPAALSVLPPSMTSDQAIRMLLAIGWQESRFQHRAQIGGPAKGFWQFEQGGGVVGVLGHERTKDIVRSAMRTLCYRDAPTPYGCHQAIRHNDVLACVFARLLLWTDWAPLPDDEAAGWQVYLRTWRPGKPHLETWPQAWAVGGSE